MTNWLPYLKNPTVCEYRRPRGKDFIYFLLIYVVIVIPIGFVAFFVCNVLGIHRVTFVLTPFKLFVGMILAPVYEEILFRSLLKFKTINILLFLITLAAFISFGLIRSDTELALFWSVLCLSFLILLAFLSRSRIESFISSQFKVVFYASILLFGLLHVFNFTGNVYYMIIFSFILTGPQLVLGSILGYIRMNYGLAHSILFHMLVNSSLVLSLKF